MKYNTCTYAYMYIVDSPESVNRTNSVFWGVCRKDEKTGAVLVCTSIYRFSLGSLYK